MEETINYRGIDIEIIQDEDPQRPDEWDNDAFLVYDHRQFYVKKEGYDPREIFEALQEGAKLYDGHWVFGVDAYIHGGVALSLANEAPFPDRSWDVSTTGFVLVKRMKGWSWTKEKARDIAMCVVEEWDDYCQGNVYGYKIEETGDSCWGFYGDPEKSGIIDEAKASIDCHIRHKRTSHWEQLKTWIKNRVPLYARKGMDEMLFN